MTGSSTASNQWFPTADAAVGGAADVVEDSGQWVLGGLGDVVASTVEGTGDVVADTGGELLGGLFRGLGQWMIFMAGLVLAVAVVAGRI